MHQDPIQSDSRPLYLYALLDGDTPLSPALCGLGDAPVRELACGEGVRAIVSAAPAGKLRPQRTHLAAHQRVLGALLGPDGVLPVGFGMVVPNARAVRELVLAEHDTLAEQFEKVRGCVEYSLRLSWDVPNIFLYFIDHEPELRTARDAMLASGASHDQKVAVGRLFEQLLATRREEHQQRMLETLRPLCEDVTLDTPKAEAEVFRAALLVRHDAQASLDAALASAASAFDESFRVHVGGPFAPYSFVRLELAVPGDAGVA